MRRFMFAIAILLAVLISSSSLFAEQTAKGRSAAAKTRATAASPVNLNSASITQLQTLPGIGVSAAQRIVDYRQKNGSFKKIEELLEISRSCPCLLMIIDFGAGASVSRSR